MVSRPSTHGKQQHTHGPKCSVATRRRMVRLPNHPEEVVVVVAALVVQLQPSRQAEAEQLQQQNLQAEEVPVRAARRRNQLRVQAALRHPNPQLVEPEVRRRNPWAEPLGTAREQRLNRPLQAQLLPSIQTAPLCQSLLPRLLPLLRILLHHHIPLLLPLLPRNQRLEAEHQQNPLAAETLERIRRHHLQYRPREKPAEVEEEVVLRGNHHLRVYPRRK
jgi:hypothetical protein